MSKQMIKNDVKEELMQEVSSETKTTIKNPSKLEALFAGYEGEYRGEEYSEEELKSVSEKVIDDITHIMEMFLTSKIIDEELALKEIDGILTKYYESTEETDWYWKGEVNVWVI